MALWRQRRRQKRARTGKRRRWQQVRAYLGVTVLCFLVALLLSIITGQLPVMVERIIDSTMADVIQKTISNPELQKRLQEHPELQKRLQEHPELQKQLQEGR